MTTSKIKGNLYLIPANIGDSDTNFYFPAFNQNIINSINHYLVENERTARRFLKAVGIKTPIQNLILHTANKHTLPQEYESFLSNLLLGHNIGMISEAGCPGIADPGAIAVAWAHKHNITVKPLVGPSSILLAIMASGFNGQNFRFLGYLPINKNQIIKTIKELEQKVIKHNETQIFMETPYRNNALLQAILKSCLPNTLLCIAANITSTNEFIKTQTIKQWLKNTPNLHKVPVIFVLGKY